MSYFYLLLNWRSPNLVERQRVNSSSSDKNLAFSNFKALKTAILNLAQIMKIVFEFIESLVGEVTVLIVWCLMPFKQYFSYIAVASAPINALLEFFRVICTIFFPSHWLLSHITTVKTRDSSERGMNPVAMTITNPLKILDEPGIELATSCSQVCNTTD